MIVAALAAYRLTRLLQKDTFPPAMATREAVLTEGPGWLVEMWECPWCLGFWVSLVTCLLMRLDKPVMRALAISVFVGAAREIEEWSPWDS